MIEPSINIHLQVYLKARSILFEIVKEKLKDTSYWLEGGTLIGIADNRNEGIILYFAYKVFHKKEVHIPWSVVNSWSKDG